MVVPALGATSQHEAMYWDVTADGEVQLVFTSGSEGITMLLRRTEAGLSGVARTFWVHGPHPEQTTPVTLESVSCTP
jgi:hypothetical protein